MQSRFWTLVVWFSLLVALVGCGHPVEGGLRFHTADPNLTITLMIPGLGPVAPVAPEVVPAEEVGLEEPEPLPPPPCEVVKGNISKDGRKLYHTPESPNYEQVKIDESKGEQFFCSVEEAEAAGWVKAGG